MLTAKIDSIRVEIRDSTAHCNFPVISYEVTRDYSPIVKGLLPVSEAVSMPSAEVEVRGIILLKLL